MSYHFETFTYFNLTGYTNLTYVLVKIHRCLLSSFPTYVCRGRSRMELVSSSKMSLKLFFNSKCRLICKFPVVVFCSAGVGPSAGRGRALGRQLKNAAAEPSNRYAARHVPPAPTNGSARSPPAGGPASPRASPSRQCTLTRRADRTHVARALANTSFSENRSDAS